MNPSKEQIMKFVKIATNENTPIATDMANWVAIEKFAHLVADYVKEQCAAMCEDHFSSDGHWIARQIRWKNDN